MRLHLALLDYIATSPDGTGTVDDTVDDLNAPHVDGGNWRGAVRTLAAEGLLVHLGFRRSLRRVRNCGTVSVWGIGDRDAVDRRRAVLRATLAVIDAQRRADIPIAPVPPSADG